MLTGSVVAAVTLLSASIAVRFEEGTRAAVVATYRFGGSPDSATFLVIGLPGQRFSEIGGVLRDSAPGGRRLTVPLDSTGSVTLRYAVEGDLTRLPVPVPTAPTSGRNTVVILVEGSGAEGEWFPRLIAEGGRLRGQLSNVPSLLQLAPDGSASPLRWLDGGIVVLLLAASVVWIRSRRLS